MDAHAWDERYAGAEPVWSLEPNRFVVAELAGLVPGPHGALDLACGEGRNAIWLARQGWAVTATDFSAAGIERGRALADDLPVTWEVGDALTMALPTVDLVVIAYLQLPADQRRTAVRRAFEALAPGGTLLVVAHDSTNLTEGTGGPQDPAVLYTAEDVLADLDGRAFEVDRAERVARPVERAAAPSHQHGGTEQLTAWDALVRLRRV